MTIDELVARLPGAKRNGAGWMAPCPAHEDKTPSLSVSEVDGKILVKCFAGCETESVVSSLGLKMADLFTNGANGNAPRLVATYDYSDEAGKLLYQVLRYSPKAFKQRRPDANGGWDWKLSDVRRVLYKLSDVRACNDLILVCEGEKDVETANKLGFVATCNSGGAGKWLPEYSEALRGKIVTIIADADERGRLHAQVVAASLHTKVAALKVIETPGAKDVSEWVANGGTRSILVDLICKAADWTPPDAPKKRRIQVYTAAELVALDPAPVKFLAFPLAASGMLSGLDGEPKRSGKTSLILRAARAMLHEEIFLNQTTQRAPVLLVTEENPRTLKEALRRAELEHESDLHIIPWTSLGGVPWSLLTEFVEQRCSELGVGLLVVDTLYALAGLQSEEENQAAAVDALVAPLRSMAASLNLAVVVTRHERKSGGPVGQSGRGTNALTGAVDIVLQLRRPEGKQPSNMRQLDILSRLDLPDRLLIQLDGAKYISLGERADVKTASAEDLILKHVPNSAAEALPESEILRRADLKRSKPVRAAVEHLQRRGDLRATKITIMGRERVGFFRGG